MDDDTRRTGMHPAVEAKWNAWAAKVARQEVARELETYSDAVGHSIAQEAKKRDAALAERDEKIAQLERRLAALEADESRVIDIGKHIKGGGRAA